MEGFTDVQPKSARWLDKKRSTIHKNRKDKLQGSMAVYSEGELWENVQMNNQSTRQKVIDCEGRGQQVLAHAKATDCHAL